MRNTLVIWTARALCVCVGLLGWLWLWLEDVVEGRVPLEVIGMEG